MNRTLFTGKRVLAALLLTSLFVVSCGPKIEYRKDETGRVTYEIVTNNGIKSWGIVIRDHNGYVLEHYLETKYDSIYCSPDIKHLYFALQNGNVICLSGERQVGCLSREDHQRSRLKIL